MTQVSAKYFVTNVNRTSVLLSQQFDRRLWYERLNLVHKLKRFCQKCAGSFWFWTTVALFTLSEPVICSYNPHGHVFIAQLIVLGVSSLLYGIQIVGVATREWEKILLIQALSSSSSTIVNVNKFTATKLLVFFTSEGEYILEFCCLLGGWLTIAAGHRGLATLRCFRVFRLLWFYEVVVFKEAIERECNPIFGPKFVARCFKVLKFAIKALTALGNEMFRLTNATRGGLLLMLMFFYSAFVLGTAVFLETDQGMVHNDDDGVAGDKVQSSSCSSRARCVFTLMRLGFYDGDAFDFVFKLTYGYRFLFIVCILYMCITSFGLLNGLVGIFGTAFAAASDASFHEEDLAQQSESDSSDSDDGEAGPQGGRKLASLVFRSFKGDVGAGGDGDSDEDGEGGVQQRAPAFGGDAPSGAGAGTGAEGRAPRGPGGIGGIGGPGIADFNWSSDDDHGGSVELVTKGAGAGAVPGGVAQRNGREGDDLDVWSLGADEPAAGAPPRGPQAPAHGVPALTQHDQLQQQVGMLSPREKVEMQRKLAGKLGAKSGFALQELQRIAGEEGNPAKLKRGTSWAQNKPSSLKHTGTGRVVPFQRGDSTKDPTAFPVDSSPSRATSVKHAPSLQEQYAAIHQHGEEKHHQHHHHHNNHHHNHHHAPAAAGMFAQTRNQHSNRSLATSERRRNSNPNLFADAVVSGNAQQALEIKALTANVQNLSRTVEAQNALILSMLRHMQQQSGGASLEGPSSSQRGGGLLHSLHAVQHAVQDSLGNILHPHLHPAHHADGSIKEEKGRTDSPAQPLHVDTTQAGDGKAAEGGGVPGSNKQAQTPATQRTGITAASSGTGTELQG